MCDALEKKLANAMWLGGAQPTQADREAIETFTTCPSPREFPNVFAWYSICGKIHPSIRAQWPAASAEKKEKEAAPKKDNKKGGKKEEKKPEPKKEEPKKAADDDDFDPFADEEEDEEAEKAKMERMKEIAKTAKNYGKAKPIAKSIIVWEVKPWGEETDLDEMAKLILAIEQDGLQWKTEYKKEPIAYGVYKLVIGATVEDEKVSTDDIAEKIEALEDFVQSVDVQSFNKL